MCRFICTSCLGFFFLVSIVTAATLVSNGKQCTERPNEIWSECPQNECRAEVCETVGKITWCCPVGRPPCAGACVCDLGFVRDKNGTCIDERTCPQYCKPHEVWSDCPEADCRPTSCELVGRPIECPVAKAPCSGGCVCERNFMRNENGDCIDMMTCPNLCSKPNEKWSDCPAAACEPYSCKDVGMPFGCIYLARDCPSACVCDRGFVRNDNGDCIDAKTCPSCGGDPNAQAGCGLPPHCVQTCAKLRSNNSKMDTYENTRFANDCSYCRRNSCDCKEGYVLNTDVSPPRCVLPEDCP